MKIKIDLLETPISALFMDDKYKVVFQDLLKEHGYDTSRLTRKDEEKKNLVYLCDALEKTNLEHNLKKLLHFIIWSDDLEIEWDGEFIKSLFSSSSGEAPLKFKNKSGMTNDRAS